jgi:hypothetical protein
MEPTPERVSEQTVAAVERLTTFLGRFPSLDALRNDQTCLGGRAAKALMHHEYITDAFCRLLECIRGDCASSEVQKFLDQAIAAESGLSYPDLQRVSDSHAVMFREVTQALRQNTTREERICAGSQDQVRDALTRLQCAAYDNPQLGLLALYYYYRLFDEMLGIVRVSCQRYGIETKLMSYFSLHADAATEAELALDALAFEMKAQPNKLSQRSAFDAELMIQDILSHAFGITTSQTAHA